MKTRLGKTLLLGLLLVTFRAAAAPPDTVVLLHGLGLGRWAMKRIERTLDHEGFRVVNLGYDSLRTPIETLAHDWLPAELAKQGIDPAVADGPTLHFVTHSMGGIILRGWLHHDGVPPAMARGRVVMLVPPNGGSTLVDRIGTWHVFRLATGINGAALSTAADSFPNQLGPWPAGPQLGVIAGDRPINPLLAHWTGSPGDGKVRVEETRLAGMDDHLVLPHSHTWIQYRKPAIRQTLAFLRDGRFSPPPPAP